MNINEKNVHTLRYVLVMINMVDDGDDAYACADVDVDISDL